MRFPFPTVAVLLAQVTNPVLQPFTGVDELAPPQAPGLLLSPDLQRFAKTVVAVLLAWLLLETARRLSQWLSEVVDRRFRLSIKQSLPFIQGLILLLATLYLVSLWINFASANVLALGGTVAVALGFAFKDVASSIVAGVLALYESSYRLGDRIQIGDFYGEVVGFGLRSVRLQTPDDNLVTIPHNVVWSDAISNSNAGALEAQVVTEFYIDCKADVKAAVRILYLAAYTSKYTQLKLPIVVIVVEKPWYTHLKLKSYPMDARDEFVYKTDLLVRGKQALQAKQIAYPQNLDRLLALESS
ncbi:MAG: mechanosensitive ion channel domain-containing protein [Cyanobacteria bacterium J06597_1]